MLLYETEGEASASITLGQGIAHQSQQVKDLNLVMLSPESSVFAP